MKIIPQNSIKLFYKLFTLLFLLPIIFETSAQNAPDLPIKMEVSYLHDNSIEPFADLAYENIIKSTQLSGIRLDSTIQEQPTLIPNYPKYEKTKNIYEYIDDVKRKLQTMYYTSEEISGNWDMNSKTDYEYNDEFEKITISSWNQSLNEWQDSLKEEFTYSNHNLITDIKYIWDDTTKMWKGHLKSERIYNDDELLINIWFYDWDDSTQSWKNNSTNVYGYDENGFLNKYLLYLYWFGDEEPTLNTKREYVNDSIGNRLQTIAYRPSTETNEWIYDSKNCIVLDTNGDLIEDNNYKWNFGADSWEPIHLKKFTYTYNENKLLILLMEEQWYTFTDEWTLSRTEYAYNHENLDTLKVIYNWDYILNEWEQTRKEENKFNIDGKRILNASYNWDSTVDRWICWAKNEFFYSEDGKMSLSAFYAWNYNTDSLEQYSKTVYIDFDLSNLIVPITTQRITYLWEKDLTDWRLDNRYAEYYSKYVINNLPDKQNIAFSVYPNPVSETLSFELNSKPVNEIPIEIFDLTGKKLISKTLMGNSLSVKGLKNGTYIYNVSSNNQIFSGKFIVQH